MSSSEYQVQTITFFQRNNMTPPSTTNGYANLMTVALPQPMDLTNSEVALASLFCYYSWPNISAAFNNNAFSYTIPDTATGTTWGTTYPVETTVGGGVLTDGVYTIADLNSALQFTLENNGHYVIDADGNNVYPLSFAVNPTAYCVTVTVTPIVEPLPTGWSYPSTGAARFTSANTFDSTVCRINIPTTSDAAGSTNVGQSSISKILGLPVQSYPPTTTHPTPASSLSPLMYNGVVPQVSVTNSINVTCNLVNASTITPIAANVIYSFSPTSESGTQIQERPYNHQWLPVTPGRYNNISIGLVTDAFQQLLNKDHAVSATILIRRKVLPSHKENLVQGAMMGEKRTRYVM